GPRKATTIKKARSVPARTAGKASRAQSKPAAKSRKFTKSGRLRAKTPRFVPARVFAWPANPRATSYIVRFFRNGQSVLRLHATRPRVALPSSFRFRPGRYRWQVIPVVGGSAGQHLPPVVDSTFVLRRR